MNQFSLNYYLTQSERRLQRQTEEGRTKCKYKICSEDKKNHDEEEEGSRRKLKSDGRNQGARGAIRRGGE